MNESFKKGNDAVLAEFQGRNAVGSLSSKDFFAWSCMQKRLDSVHPRFHVLYSFMLKSPKSNPKAAEALMLLGWCFTPLKAARTDTFVFMEVQTSHHFSLD